MSQATKRAWRRWIAGLCLVPLAAEGGLALYAQSKSPPAMTRTDVKENAKAIVKQGRLYLQAGDLAKAMQCAEIAAHMNVKWEFYDDSPDKLAKDIQAVSGQRPTPMNISDAVVDGAPALRPISPDAGRTLPASGVGGTMPSPGVLPASSPSATPALTPLRQQALALLIECRQLQKAEKFIEAKTKAIEAQRLNAEFAPHEDHPDRALLEISSQAAARIDAVVQYAMTMAAIPNPESGKKAIELMLQARQYAAGMGLSTIAIDERLGQITGHVASERMATAPAVVDHKAQGLELLKKAQLEMRNGNMSGARQLVETVFAGPYGLQSEATAFLRTIEAEEHNQRILSANRAYEAGMQAFAQGDYAKAGNIFVQIDGSLLSTDKRDMMRQTMTEANKMAAAKPDTPAMASPVVPALQTVSNPPSLPAVPPGTPPGTPGKVRISDQPAKSADPLPPGGAAENYAGQVKAMQEIEFQRQRAEGQKLLSEARVRFDKGETDAAIQLLTDHLNKLKGAPLDKSYLDLLTRQIEYRLQMMKVVKAQKDAEVSLALRGQQFHDKQMRRVEAEHQKHKQVADLMKQFNSLMDDGKFREAELLALKAEELDPNAEAPKLAKQLAKMRYRVDTVQKDKDGKERMVWQGLRETDLEGPFVGGENAMVLDGDRLRRAEMRASRDAEHRIRRSEREREIERKLSTPISVDFQGMTLHRALDDLRVMTKVNIIPALDAIAEENPKALDQPVTLRVDQIPLKSLLNILLKQVRLTYVIADDVLQVTTEKGARGKLVQKVYSVADLVIPIDNFSIPNASLLHKQFDRVAEHGAGIRGLTTAYQPQHGLTGGTPVSTNAMSTTPGGQPPSSEQRSAAGPLASSSFQTLNKNTLEDVLKKLILNTVAPQSWQDVGGSGSIDYFPIGMALVVNQTPDVQEQVADLLEALRRLQDLEVAIECRIVTVAETFFERIGMDFGLNFKTDSITDKIEPQLVTGQFKPNGFLNDRNWRGILTGVNPAGALTSDLDIPLKATSFQWAIPPFAYPNMPGNQGGLSLGLAFLNEIEVFMFMEAAQGDRRTNVMQAPKLTLFNGQTSTVEIADFQFFVTSVTVASVNGQIVFVPNNTPFPVGTSGLGTTGGGGGVGIAMTLSAVVSADRRFVRISIAQNLSSLASATVPLFPVTTFVTPTFEGGFVGQPIPFTQFIQQPRFSSVGVATTVSVPDGGTVLLGGLKTLSEGRNEFGPPILSKIPYLNRLVKNTGYGREAQHMMLMLTPRIIINSEEAERQTGELPIQPQ